MLSSRRLAKRSIIGTRICCLRQDGRFYPGIITSTDTVDVVGNDKYTVRFEDYSTTTASDADIVGPGFRSVSSVKFLGGQKVFITHNGREVTGLVEDHDEDAEELSIFVTINEKEMHISRRVEEVRLMESRKSARLQDQDTDYSRLADHSENKKRAVSHVIDVPFPTVKSRRRKSSGSSFTSIDDGVRSPDEEASEHAKQILLNNRISACENGSDSDMDCMDEHMAAMVLTSLSCSPTSPHFPVFPSSYTEKPRSISPNVVSSFGSSGISSGASARSLASTPSPPHVAGSGAPPPATVFSSLSVDEGIEMDDTHAYFMEDFGSAKRRKQSAAIKTVFKCTWPGCGKMYNSNSGIEYHVRDQHLGPRDEDEDSDMSDHEEEFYYTELEVSVDTVTETFADMHTSSPPDSTPERQHACLDHDYQKKEPFSLPQNIPGRSQFNFGGPHHGASYPFTAAGQQKAAYSSSWDMPSRSGSPPLRVSKSIQGSRNLCSPLHKKSRSDVKKCRKVYGMENRDLWCTQCKWKKACTRFND